MKLDNLYHFVLEVKVSVKLGLNGHPAVLLQTLT